MHPTTCSPQVYQVEERELLEVPLIVITALTAFLSLKIEIDRITLIDKLELRFIL